MGFLTSPSIDQVDPNTQVAQDVQGSISPFLQNLFSTANQGLAGGGNPLATFIGQQGPEQQTFDNLQGGLLDIFGGDSGQSFGNAASEISQRNLQASLGQLSSAAPGRFSTAFTNQGIGLAQRAQQDLTLLQQQFGQQDIANRLGAGGLLGTLAGGAGQAQLGQQQQLLQLLLGGLGFAQPAPLDTIVGSSPLDSLLGAGLSAFGISQFGGGGNTESTS